MFSIMIVKHHYETLVEHKRQEVLVKRIGLSVDSSPLTPQAKYRALYFPGFAGQNLGKISEYFQAPVEPGIMDNCNFPPGTQCGFLGISGRAEKGRFRQKKKWSFHAVFETKKWDLLSIFQFSKSLSRKIHLLKAPQRGPVDGNPEIRHFRQFRRISQQAGISQQDEITQFYRKSIKSKTFVYKCISQHIKICKYL